MINLRTILRLSALFLFCGSVNVLAMNDGNTLRNNDGVLIHPDGTAVPTAPPASASTGAWTKGDGPKTVKLPSRTTAQRTNPPVTTTPAPAPAPAPVKPATPAKPWFSFLRQVASRTKDAFFFKPSFPTRHYREEGGVYQPLQAATWINLVDGVIEWQQCLADVDRLGATTPERFNYSPAHRLLNKVVGVLRNGLKLVLGFSVCDNAYGMDDEGAYTAASVALMVTTSANILHSLLRYKDTWYSAQDVQLFTAYNSRLTAAEKDRLAAVKAQLRSKAHVLKGGIKQLATLRHAEMSTAPMWLLSGDNGSTIYLRTIKANYMGAILGEARKQHKMLSDLHTELTGRIRNEYMMPQRLERLQAIDFEVKILLDYVRGERTEEMVKAVLVFEGERLDNDVLNGRIARLRAAADRER